MTMARPWMMKLALTGFAALLYYAAAADWWLPRTTLG